MSETCRFRFENQEDAIKFQNYINDKYNSVNCSIVRICDGCESNVDENQQSLTCENCFMKFDLCLSCSDHMSHNKCPKGWGCRKDDLSFE